MLSLPITEITIDGTTYTAAQQATEGIHVDSWGWDYDGDLEAEFHEAGNATTTIGQPRWVAGQAVTVTVDSTAMFVGEIASVHPTHSAAAGWTIAYRCRGPKYQANQLYVTGSDDEGRAQYNLGPRDEDYVPSLAGLTVGDIVDSLLTLHASALSALGITTDATTATQLAAMDLVPPEPVRVAGRLWVAIESVLRQWLRTYATHITAGGKVRFYDTTAGTTIDLEEGTDPVDPFRFAYSLEDVATRVVVRGRAAVYPFYASVLGGTLTPAWDGAQEGNWTLDDYTKPGDASSAGAVTSILSSTSVRIDPTSASETHTANFWSDRQAWLYLEKAAGTGLTFGEQVPVTASTSYSAGGTCDLTLGLPLENAGSGAYDSYRMIGTAGPLDGSDPGLVDVWRLYDVTDPGGLVADHLVRHFPTEVPFVGYYGDSTSLTKYPIGVVVNSTGSAYPVGFSIIPQTGQIRFDKPTVDLINSKSKLEAGGTNVTAPADVYVLLAYSRGALTATYPPDSGGAVFEGDAFDRFALERTAYIDIDSWVYRGDAARMADYAQMVHESISAPIVEQTIVVRGYYSDAATPGKRLNLASADLTTGWEDIAAPIRGFRLQYHNDAAGGVLHTSHIRVSTRRNPRTGDRFYVNPTTMEQLTFKLGLNGLNGLNPGVSFVSQSLRDVQSGIGQSFNAAARSGASGVNVGTAAAAGLGQSRQGVLGSFDAKLDEVL